MTSHTDFYEATLTVRNRVSGKGVRITTRDGGYLTDFYVDPNQSIPLVKEILANQDDAHPAILIEGKRPVIKTAKQTLSGTCLTTDDGFSVYVSEKELEWVRKAARNYALLADEAEKLLGQKKADSEAKLKARRDALARKFAGEANYARPDSYHYSDVALLTKKAIDAVIEAEDKANG